MPLPEPLPNLMSLDLLVTLAETTSLRRAGNVHRISQPAASQRLRSLEQCLQLQLVERGPRGSVLTPAGAAVVEWARDIMRSVEELVLGAQALRDPATRGLDVSASMTVAEYMMPRWLASLRQSDQGAQVLLRMANSETVIDDVLMGRVELGFVEGPHIPRGVRSRTIGRDRLVVVVSTGHPWARRRTGISLAELAATPLLMREPGSGTREALEQILMSFPDRPAPALEAASTTAILSAVERGAGPAVVSELAVDAQVHHGQLARVRLRDAELVRPLRAVWDSARPPEGLASALLSISMSSTGGR